MINSQVSAHLLRTMIQPSMTAVPVAKPLSASVEIVTVVKSPSLVYLRDETLFIAVGIVVCNLVIFIAARTSNLSYCGHPYIVNLVIYLLHV